MANKKNPTTKKDEKGKKTSSPKKVSTAKKTATTKTVKTSGTKPSGKSTKKATSSKKTTTETKAKTASKKSTSSKKTTTSAKKTAPKSKTATKKTQVPKKGATSTSEETLEKKPLILENTEVEVTVEPVIEEKPEIIEDSGEKKQNQSYAKTILGAKIPTGTSLEARKKRHRYYMLDSIMFATILPILDLFMILFCPWYTSFLSLDSVQNCIVVLVLDFIIVFIATYLIDYAVSEGAIKKINKNK